MSELQVLLERINSKNEVVKGVEKPAESPFLQALVGRIETRKWRDDMLHATLERLCNLQEDIDFIHHLFECKQCQAEVAIDLTRHGGNHSGLWFICVSDGDILHEAYPDCPSADRYNWGSYWTGENFEEAIRFIFDRAKWALSKLEKELYTVIDFYLALESWDLKSPLPPWTSDEELFSWLPL